MVRQDKKLGGGMRRVVSAALILTGILFFLPVLVVRGEPVCRRDDVASLPGGESALPIDRAPAVPSSGCRAKGRAGRRPGAYTQQTRPTRCRG